MTVQEVIDYLSTIDDKSMEMLIAKDSDGNNSRPLAEVLYFDVNEYGKPCHPDDADYQRPGVVVMW